MSCFKFTNNNFTVLSFLYDVSVDGTIVHITQQEIADKLGFSRSTISKIMNFLIIEQYISVDKEHLGRYGLTDKATHLINVFRSV